MEIALAFKDDGSVYQFEAHSNGKFAIRYQSSWNSNYNWQKENLSFQEFVKAIQEIKT